MQQAEFHSHRHTPWMQESVSMHKSPTPLRHLPERGWAFEKEDEKERKKDRGLEADGNTEAWRLMERKAAQKNKNT